MKHFEQLGPKIIFVYDLEFIGDVNNIKTCQIWDISILCVHSGETYNVVIDPDPVVQKFPPPVVDGLFNLTREFLDENNALPFNNMWPNVVRWVESRTFGGKSVFISHNNFSSDKPVLENHMTVHGTSIPQNWLFFDSLHYFRDNIQGTGDYSLKGLVHYILKTDHDGAHRAEADTIKLTECIKRVTDGNWNLRGPLYPPFYSSLRKLKGIGAMVETVFWNNGISCEEFLLHTISHVIQLGLPLKTPRQSVQEFLFNILNNGNIPMDNIQVVINSVLLRYVGANTFNDVFN
jgi:hypothetical protein